MRHADRFENQMIDGQQVTTFVGNVRIEHKETRIACERATYFETEGKILLDGDVEILQPRRTIRADRMEYFERSREVVGVGDSVRIVDAERRVTARGGKVRYSLDSESGCLTETAFLVKEFEDGRIESTLAGDTLQLLARESKAVAHGDSVVLVDEENALELRGTFVFYDYDQKYGRAEGRSTISKMDERRKPLLTVVSDTAEVFSDDDVFEAAGNVKMEREHFAAQSERALFRERGERITLQGQPVLQQSNNRLSGDEIELTLSDWKVTEVVSRGAARATSTSPSDTVEGAAEMSELSGKHIALYLKDEEAESLVVSGSANSLYRAKGEGRNEVVNEASGDTIVLYFDQGKIDRTLIVGGARGTYCALSSSGEERADTVLYRSDRIEYTIAEETILLDGDNRIDYRTLVLTADHITFDTATDVLTAEGVPDSVGRLVGTPVLKDGQEEIEGTWLDYNLKTKKGKIRKGTTQYEKGFYKGEKIRKVADRVLNIDHGIYTTCDLNEPHFHFYTRRMKFYQDDKVIAKPVVLYFGDVPVFALPYYVFPIKKGRHSGLLVPRYGSSDVDGRYLRDAGYYFASSDYWDTLLKVSLYERTGWMLESRFRYALRYRFSGTVEGSYRWDRRYVGSSEKKTRRWNFRLNHSHTLIPTLAVKASGDFVSDERYYQDVSYSPYERMERTLRSELVLDKRWQTSSLSLRLNQERNLDTDRTTENLPVLTFRKSQAPLFGARSGDDESGKKIRAAWYRSLYYSYNLLFVNWGQKTGDKVERHAGADHKIDLTGSQTIGGWLGVTPRVSLRETWYDEDREGNRWVRRGYYDASLSANTTLYGLFRPGIGPLTWLRHKIQPRLSFSYRPEFENRDRYYSFGGIGGIPGPQKTLGIGLSNFFQGKTLRGEQEKKFDIATFDVSTGYDFRAEGKRFSAVNSTLRLYPSKSLNVDLGSTHSLYRRDTDEFEPWHPALQNVNVTTTFSLTSEGTGRSSRGSEEYVEEFTEYAPLGQKSEVPPSKGQEGVRRGAPWNVTLSHYYSLTKSVLTSRTQWLRGRIDFYLTKNWKIEYSGTFDMEKSRFTSQQVELYRDLHCWEAQFVWVPTGGREGYYFRINIKALPDVKIERGRGISGFGL